MALTTWPTATDDSGTGTDGTVLNNAFFVLQRDAINAELAKLEPFIVFLPAQQETAAGAGVAAAGTRNGHKTLDFDGATDEEAIFSGVLPLGYTGGGLTVDVFVAFPSGTTSGSVRFQAAIERIDLSGLDIDADSFSAFQSAGGTAPATAGMVIKVSIAMTHGAQMDSLAAGEPFRLKVRRDADGTSGTDDIAADANVIRVVLRET